MEACTIFFVILTGGLLFLKARTQINLVPWVKSTQPSTMSNCSPNWTLRTFPSEGRWFPRHCERWNCFADRFLLEVDGWFPVGQCSWVNRPVLCCVCILGSLERTFSPAWCQMTPWLGLQRPVSCTKQRNHTQRWRNETRKCDWELVLPLTQRWLIIDSRLLWPVLMEALLWSHCSSHNLRKQVFFFMPTRINHLLTVHKHTNNTSQGHLLIVNTH